MQPQLSEQDLAKLIPEFYARVRADPVLGPVFNRAIADWDEHLEKLQAFWSSIMLTSGRYKGQPMVAHLRHEGAMTKANFDRWLALWRRTTGDLLDPGIAAVLQAKAARIAESLQLSVQFQRERLARS
ncbi:group III truncated hemoglobin [Sphingopyxis sp. NFH-91]|uniref:group III truncated hemoglobin n=1 Tax=Sphingopyxis sp. NFH-91 TaxID=2744457 RepID=UPI001F18E2B6|nr:group III truncated hemoglobin [Sphingopyxis sp. NFH-91]